MNEKIEIKVRFSETDLLGHVNNSSYFVYLEEARVEFFKKMKPYNSDKSFVVASVTCDFINQAYFDDRLVIHTEVTKMGNKSFQLKHEIINKESNKLIAKGKSAIVFFNFKKQMSEPIPEEIRRQLENYFTAGSKTI